MEFHKIRKEENARLKEEYHLHRWYRQRSEIDPWRSRKMLLTIFVGLFLGAGGYLFLASEYNIPLPALCAGIAIFMGIICLNTPIRSALSKVFISHPVVILDLYKDTQFYFLEGQDNILFIQTDKAITALGLFQVIEIPLMIKANLRRLMRVLYSQEIPLVWTYTQAPLDQVEITTNLPVPEELETHSSDIPGVLEEKVEPEDVVRVLLGTFIKKNLLSKRSEIVEEITHNLTLLHSLIHGVYPHSALKALHGTELYHAYKILITCGGNAA